VFNRQEPSLNGPCPNICIRRFSFERAIGQASQDRSRHDCKAEKFDPDDFLDNEEPISHYLDEAFTSDNPSALALQRPAPDDMLRVVAIGTKQDGVSVTRPSNAVAIHPWRIGFPRV
jgi:hypothetical protein